MASMLRPSAERKPMVPTTNRPLRLPPKTLVIVWKSGSATTGTGITPDVKEKMFEPFFTTKPTGEGTGLGLSISHDIIVKQHAGTIEVDTRPGEFTEIRIILPRT